MKCEIIRDLLPAYCDEVCSEETAAEIKAHTAECSECRKMLEALEQLGYFVEPIINGYNYGIFHSASEMCHDMRDL